MKSIEDIILEYSKNSTDFGFSTIAEELKTQADTKEQEIIQLKNKLKEVEELLMPFLINLMNAKGDSIRWPQEQRAAQIKAQIEKLLKITR